MRTYNVEMTDTFSGEANYCWVKRETITMPELAHYGYDGSTNYRRANKVFRRELIRKVKAALNLTGARCDVQWHGDDCEIRPRCLNVVVFVNYKD